jgi:23S rRNA pseudouridine2457 synthase
LHQYFIVHKPFQVLSQFSSLDGKQTLKDYFDVPLNVYPVGRLDYDSEGLLLLTDDKKLNDYLLNPVHRHEREYWVQVDGAITGEALEKIMAGVMINIDGRMHRSQKCYAEAFDRPLSVGDRNPPVRFRKNIPDTWLRLIITEGKNRQVRKMTAKVGYPTLRLIRYRIQGITLENLQPGQMKMLSQTELYNLLQIKKR